MPLAAHAQVEAGVLHLRAAWGEPEGDAPLLRADAAEAVADEAAAAALGARVAAALRAQGAH